MLSSNVLIKLVMSSSFNEYSLKAKRYLELYLFSIEFCYFFQPETFFKLSMFF